MKPFPPMTASAGVEKGKFGVENEFDVEKRRVGNYSDMKTAFIAT